MQTVNLIELVNRYGGRLMTGAEMRNAIGPAQRKLDYIISRYGDGGGERRNPEYLAKLIVETVNEQRYAESFLQKGAKKKSTAKQYPPKTVTSLYQVY